MAVKFVSAATMKDIANYIQGMKFKRKLFGGLDEQDVWRQMAELQKQYRSAYEAMELVCLTILREHGCDTAGFLAAIDGGRREETR